MVRGILCWYHIYISLRSDNPPPPGMMNLRTDFLHNEGGGQQQQQQQREKKSSAPASLGLMKIPALFTGQEVFEVSRVGLSRVGSARLGKGGFSDSHGLGPVTATRPDPTRPARVGPTLEQPWEIGRIITRVLYYHPGVV